MPIEVQKLKDATVAADDASDRAQHDWLLAELDLQRADANAAVLRAAAVELLAASEDAFFAWQNALTEAETEAEREAVESANRAH